MTRTLIVINVLAFIVELSHGDTLPEFVRDWGLVPGRLFASLTDPMSFPREAGTLLTSMFLHADGWHLIGNMWYLWIFGDNVEDRMGPARFLAFYLSCGVVASGVHASLMPGSPIPTLGASGAIAGVLGAYALAFPRARVLTLIPIFFFFRVVAVPALVLLGIWFVFQFVSGALSIGSTIGGVAWWAHISGFVFGFVAMGMFTRAHGGRAGAAR